MKRLHLLVILFSLSAVGAAILSYQVLDQFSALSAKTAEVDHVHAALILLSSLEAGIKDVERLERGYLLTADSSYVAPINTAINNIWPDTKNLRDYYAAGSLERSTTLLLRTDVAERIRAVRTTVANVSAGRPVPAANITKSRAVTRASLQKIDSLRTGQTKLLHKQTERRGTFSDRVGTWVRSALIILGLGTLALFILLARELQRNLRYQDRLRQQLAALRQAHAELDQIAYAVSHHVQEPLRKIGLFSDRLLRQQNDVPLPEVTADAVRRLAASALQAQRLVNDLAGFAALSSGAEDAAETVSLSQVVRSVSKAMEQNAMQKGAVISVGNLPDVAGRERQLQTLFAALLDNALKFAHADRTPEISISASSPQHPPPDRMAARKLGLYHAIHISDNGLGFEKSYETEIFRLFYRLEGPGAGGQGLGLALAQRIMINHGGWIEASGRLGKGATFTLYFPAGAA